MFPNILDDALVHFILKKVIMEVFTMIMGK